MRTDWMCHDDMAVLLRLLMPANALVLELCLCTGLRVGDVLALRTADMRQRMSVYEHKTGKRKRIYIPKRLFTRLMEQAGSVWVWPNARDAVQRHRCRQTVWKDVKRAARALRVEANIAPHSARKIYAVEYYHEHGLAATQRALQHNNVNTTLIYLASELLDN